MRPYIGEIALADAGSLRGAVVLVQEACAKYLEQYTEEQDRVSEDLGETAGYVLGDAGLIHLWPVKEDRQAEFVAMLDKHGRFWPGPDGEEDETS